jgi:hypothetical protein
MCVPCMTRPADSSTGSFNLDIGIEEGIAERHAAVQRWRAAWADERAIGDAVTVAAFVEWSGGTSTP